MYKPSYRTQKNGVPVLREGFIERCLGMTTDYQYLSHNGIYLGMTVFNDTNKVPVYDPVARRAEYISAKARTVNANLGEKRRVLYASESSREAEKESG